MGAYLLMALPFYGARGKAAQPTKTLWQHHKQCLNRSWVLDSQGDLLPVGASSAWQRGDDDSCKLQAEQPVRPWHEVAIEPPSLLSSAERLFPSLPWRKSSVCGSEGMKHKITVIPSGLLMLGNNLCEPSVFHQLVSGNITSAVVHGAQSRHSVQQGALLGGLCCASQAGHVLLSGCISHSIDFRQSPAFGQILV